MVAESQLATCVAKSPHLQVGNGLDAPGRLEADHAPGAEPAGACQGNTAFRYGSGLYDITGVVANTGGMGWESPTQVFSGLHQRQYARAFAIASPCNGKRVLFVSSDTGMVFGSVRTAVLDAIAADPELSALYGPDNVMLSATHAHQGPAGYSHYEAFNTFHFGFDATVFQAISNGIVQAIKLAHANFKAHPETAPIGLAVGELLNTNINRSLPAFVLNAETERREFLNSRNEPVEVDKRFVQLNLVRGPGSAAGVINWFGVHPTILGTDLTLVSSDHKGAASLLLEKLMRTSYTAPAGSETFVAAFAQTDEGDSSPNIFIGAKPFPDPTRGGGKDAYESTAISATKQVNKALQLLAQGTALKGGVDYRFFHVRMDAVTVSDPVVLAGLKHPAALDAATKRTCLAALGPSFAAGAEDGPGPATEGVSCNSDPDVIAAAQADAAAFAAGKLPTNAASATALCNLGAQPALDLGCHAEKPVSIILGPPNNFEPNILPFQLFRIGNFALLGVPWEVTTMSARRLRKTLLDVLGPVGVDTVIVAGLVNEYSHYLTTREEYSSQQYEGASNIYGPWSLAAVQQESRRLALALRDGAANPAGPAYPNIAPKLIRPPYNPSDTPGMGGEAFGALITDVPATAAPGDTVRAEWQAGHPRNDLKIQGSYVFAERQLANGSWQVVARDGRAELLYVWKPAMPSASPTDPATTGPSTAEAVWMIPANTPPGVYRLRHEGAARMSAAMAAAAYEGVSSPFTIAGTSAECP